MRTCVWIVAAFAVVFAASTAWAGLSANVITGGGFESDTYLKQHATPDGGGPTGDDPIPNHRFSQDYDVGMWLMHWGQPSLAEFPFVPGVDAGGGWSMHDDPRDLVALDQTVGNNNGYNSMFKEDIGNVNVSVDPYNAGNHVLDVTMFRPMFGTYVAAPATPAATNAPIKFTFDFFYEDWDDADPTNAHYAEVKVYGLNFLPTNDTSVFNTGPGSFQQPLGGDPIGAPVGDGEILARFNWGGWYTDPGQVGGGIDDTGGWVTVDSANEAYLWDDASWHYLSMMPSKSWDYYAIVVDAAAYHEAHMYFWYYDKGRVTDTFYMGFDDFNLQVTTQQAGDFNLDGITNLLDINDFVLALTNMPGYMVAYPTADIPAIDPSQMANPGDPIINLLDINPFVILLTGGGEAGAIPEPASIGLLVLGGLALLRRR